MSTLKDNFNKNTISFFFFFYVFHFVAFEKNIKVVKKYAESLSIAGKH